MKIETLNIVCFSPTGTTKAVARSIARGIDHKTIELIDITRHEKRTNALAVSENDLLIVAVPVYMGRVPDLITGWLQTIKASNTPAIAVVVYGNRAYENALIELKDILTGCGCKTIAGAAYIGEHSFSGEEFPCSVGRPDASDLQHAEFFGNKINEMIKNINLQAEIACIHVPGNFPYGGVTKLWDVDFIAVSDSCTQCGACAELCPAGAISQLNSNLIDIVKCITCCACIKNCPQNARKMKPGLVKDAAARVNKLYSARKEPETFL